MNDAGLFGSFTYRKIEEIKNKLALRGERNSLEIQVYYGVKEKSKMLFGVL